MCLVDGIVSGGGDSVVLFGSGFLVYCTTRGSKETLGMVLLYFILITIAYISQSIILHMAIIIPRSCFYILEGHVYIHIPLPLSCLILTWNSGPPPPPALFLCTLYFVIHRLPNSPKDLKKKKERHCFFIPS